VCVCALSLKSTKQEMQPENFQHIAQGNEPRTSNALLLPRMRDCVSVCVCVCVCVRACARARESAPILKVQQQLPNK